MQITQISRKRLSAILWLVVSTAANGALVFSQPPGSPLGGGLPSQFWYDPTQQNNLDSDAAAYDDFTLARRTTVTHVEWWGDLTAWGSTTLGFFVEFYNQDTNTTAVQPDLTQFYGHPPLSSELVTQFSMSSAGNGVYLYAADLAQPLTLLPNRRYFFSVVDSDPAAYATWGWAQGLAPNGVTFYYQLAGSLAGGPYYSLLPSDRAFALYDASPRLTSSHTTTNTLALSWPTNATGFALQQNTDLASLNWANVTNAVVTAGANNQVIIALTDICGFFRLFHP